MPSTGRYMKAKSYVPSAGLMYFCATASMCPLTSRANALAWSSRSASSSTSTVHPRVEVAQPAVEALLDASEPVLEQTPSAAGEPDESRQDGCAHEDCDDDGDHRADGRYSASRTEPTESRGAAGAAPLATPTR